MGAGIYAALSGAIAQQSALEHTATNLANAETTGYKSIRPVFREVMARQTETGEPIRFSSIRRTTVDTSAGAIEATGRPLDIALAPGSFLAVQTAQGERYTRAGSLTVRPDGTLTTQNGIPVLSEGNREPIKVDPNQPVSLSKQGEVQTTEGAVGFLRIVEFDDPAQLTPEGQTLFAAERGAGAPRPAQAEVEVGSLEQSNTSTVRAMTDLMAATRMFDAMQKAITTFKGIDRRLVTVVPKA